MSSTRVRAKAEGWTRRMNYTIVGSLERVCVFRSAPILSELAFLVAPFYLRPVGSECTIAFHALSVG